MAESVGHQLVTVATYAGAGAAVGSVIPGVGTAVGGAVGGVVGGLVSLFGSDPQAQQYNATVNGQTIDARQIWEKINPGNAQPLQDGASAAAALEQVHTQRAQQINNLNTAMDAAWQGDSSSQAQAGAHPLTEWFQDSANNLNQSQTHLTNQSSAFGTVHSQVQEIAATPPHAGLLDDINPFSDKDDQINKYNQQGQANIQAFNAYYQASAQNASGMPQYSAWQGNTFSDGGQNSGGYGGVGGTGGSGGYAGAVGAGAHAGSASSLNVPNYQSHLPSLNTGGAHAAGTGAGTTGSAGTGYQDPTTTSPYSGTTAAGYTVPDSSSSFGPGGFGSGGSSFGPGGSGAGGYGAGGAGTAGYGAAGYGVAGFGPGAAGGLGSGASTGAGAGSGSAAGGASAGTAGTAGAAGRAGTSGASGMGRGGGGHGQGSEDEEHETKYLISEDPNDLFGTDELTAPPVIGE